MNDQVLRVSWAGDHVTVASASGGEQLALEDLAGALVDVCEAWVAGAEAIEVSAPAGLVALDADGAVLRSLVGRQPDTAPDAGWLTGRLPGGAADWVAAVGAEPSAEWTLAKLSWLHRSDAEAWAGLRHAVTPQAWLAKLLTGVAATSARDAASTGAWGVDGGWRFDLLAIVDSQREWSDAVSLVLADGAALGEWRGLPVRAGR